MRNAEFFIEKSESFLAKLENLTLTPYTHGSLLGNVLNELNGEDNRLFNNQKDELLNIEFEVNLMLSEFDNGKLFIEKLKNFDNCISFDNEPHRDHIKSVVELFISFLKEYRAF